MAAIRPGQTRTQFAVPQISNDDLMSFFESHFSDTALQTFNSDFFSPEKLSDGANAEPSYEEEGDFFEEDDDGLGYYPDGVKRTLTDEQVAMFRHSEIEALKREQERAAERHASAPEQNLETGEIGDGSLKDTEPSHQPGKASKNKKKRKAGKAKNYEPKPDLRKRTWDVVEAGLDSLDYD